MSDPIPHMDIPLTRREMLLRGGAGFGALALAGLLGDISLRAASPSGSVHGVGGGSWTVPARAKSCIFLFMEGGPSHIDTFDPKPLVNELAGKPLPSSFKPVITPMGESGSPILPVKRKWARHGKGG